MASFSSSLHVLAEHTWLGAIAALLFVAGLGTAGPVVARNWRALMAGPMWIVRLVLRIIGPDLRPLRVFLAIFLFNAAAIFLYMVSGVLIVVPAAMAFLTGLNIGVVMLRAGELELPGSERPLASVLRPGEAAPTPGWVNFCGLLVLLLELPCLWISVGMGIGMARNLVVPGSFTLDMMRVLLAERVHAYWMIVLPALLVSAIAETLAIRGQAGRGRAS